MSLYYSIVNRSALAAIKSIGGIKHGLFLDGENASLGRSRFKSVTQYRQMRRYFDEVCSQRPGADLIQQRLRIALLLVVHLGQLEGSTFWTC